MNRMTRPRWAHRAVSCRNRGFGPSPVGGRRSDPILHRFRRLGRPRQVSAAIHDDAELDKDLKVLQSRLALRVQPLISWDRRVDLAVVLARAKVTVLAKKQLMLCINAIDDHRIRSLSPGSIYRLLVLCRGLGVTMPPANTPSRSALCPQPCAFDCSSGYDMKPPQRHSSNPLKTAL